MSSHIVSNTVQKSNSLRSAMRGNGIFSGLSGAIMLLGARPLAHIPQPRERELR